MPPKVNGLLSKLFGNKSLINGGEALCVYNKAKRLLLRAAFECKITCGALGSFEFHPFYKFHNQFGINHSRNLPPVAKRLIPAALLVRILPASRR